VDHLLLIAERPHPVERAGVLADVVDGRAIR
jgi:hypothetical protein